MRELERTLRAGQLTFLSLAHNRIDDEAARLLAKSPVFTGLEALNVNETSITDEGAKILVARFGAGVAF